MDIYHQIYSCLTGQSILSTWNILKYILQYATKKKPSHWILPQQVCLAVGGNEQQALIACATTAAFHTSLVLVDDLLDGDGRAEKLGLSSGEMANCAQAFLATSFEVIANSSASLETRQHIMAHISQTTLVTGLGQHWDTHEKLDETTYWRITRAKSSPFFNLAFYCGARLGGVSEITAKEVGGIGSLYGEMIQIHDDLRDALETPAAADWAQGRFSLPILFAVMVNHPERDTFISLRSRVQEVQKLKEAQKILFRCGAVSYCVFQLIQRYELAQRLLEEIELPNKGSVEVVLKKVVDPARHLLNKAETGQLKIIEK